MICFGLQWLSVSGTDDIYYARKAKEMFITKNYLQPDFNKYGPPDNPPFFFWILTLSFSLFGTNDLSAHIPVAFCGIASIILTFFYARYVFKNNYVGILAMFFMSSMVFFIDYSRVVMMETTVTLLSLLCIFFFWIAKDKPWFYLLWGFMSACSVLTKSIIGGLAFINCIIYTIFFDRQRLLSVWIYAGISTFILLVGGYFMLIYSKESSIPHFEYLYSISLNKSHGKTIWHYFFTDANARSIYYPWFWLVLGGSMITLFDYIKNCDKRKVFIICYIFIPLILLSFSNYKSYWYPTFVLPGCAVLCAISIYKVFEILKIQKYSEYFIISFIFFGYFYFLLPIRKNSVMNRVTFNLAAGYDFMIDSYRNQVHSVENILIPENQRLITYAPPSRFYRLRRVLWLMNKHYVTELSEIQQVVAHFRNLKKSGINPIAVCFLEDFFDIKKYADLKVLSENKFTELVFFQYIGDKIS